MYSLTLLLLLVLTMWTASIEAKKHKTLRCHMCDSKSDLECDFIHSRFTKFLIDCPNTVDANNKTTKANCMVQRFTQDKVPHSNRLCGPANCPELAKCCYCSDKGCNGDNQCAMAFSNADVTNSFQLLTCLSLLIFCCKYYLYGYIPNI